MTEASPNAGQPIPDTVSEVKPSSTDVAEMAAKVAAKGSDPALQKDLSDAMLGQALKLSHFIIKRASSR